MVYFLANQSYQNINITNMFFFNLHQEFKLTSATEAAQKTLIYVGFLELTKVFKDKNWELLYCYTQI